MESSDNVLRPRGARWHWNAGGPTRRRALAAGLIALGALVAGRLLFQPAGSRRHGPMRRAWTHREILDECQWRLAAARADVARCPGDGRAHLRLAILELRRAFLLAMAASEAAPDPSDADARRQEHVRRDPEGAMAAVDRSAEAALRARLDSSSKRQAARLLANVRARRGDAHGEVRALQEATHLTPDDPALWARLAAAHARARQFSRAEAAMSQAQRLGFYGD